MAQLVRVDDRVDALDLAVGDVERHDVQDPLLPVEAQEAGVAVHLDRSERGAFDGPGELHPVHQHPRHPMAPEHRVGDRPHLAAAVTVQGDVVGQQGLEPVEVAGFGGRQEPAGQLVALLREVSNRGRSWSMWRRARTASCRHAASLLPTISAMAS